MTHIVSQRQPQLISALATRAVNTAFVGSAIILFAFAIGTVGCSKEDKTFGSSYDACILRNANHGDDDTRTTAQQICSRHFERAPTKLEKSYADGKATVDFAPLNLKDNSKPNSSNQLYDPYNVAPDKPSGDVISVTIKNRNDDVIIRAVHVDAQFYDGPPSDGWDYSHRRLIKALSWDAEANVEPGQSDTVSGSFDDGKAPSRFYSAHFEPTKVLSHTGAVQKSLLQETPR